MLWLFKTLLMCEKMMMMKQVSVMRRCNFCFVGVDFCLNGVMVVESGK